MSNVGLHAAPFCGLYRLWIEWEKRDPTLRFTITINGQQLVVLKLGYFPGATVPLYAVAYEEPVDERLPGRTFKLSLLVSVWVVRDWLVTSDSCSKTQTAFF